jgi:hypothetical protein
VNEAALTAEHPGFMAPPGYGSTPNRNSNSNTDTGDTAKNDHLNSPNTDTGDIGDTAKNTEHEAFPLFLGLDDCVARAALCHRPSVYADAQGAVDQVCKPCNNLVTSLSSGGDHGSSAGKGSDSASNSSASDSESTHSNVSDSNIKHRTAAATGAAIAADTSRCAESQAPWSSPRCAPMRSGLLG